MPTTFASRAANMVKKSAPTIEPTRASAWPRRGPRVWSAQCVRVQPHAGFSGAMRPMSAEIPRRGALAGPGAST